MTTDNISKILTAAGKVDKFSSVTAFNSWKQNVHRLLKFYPVPEDQTLDLLYLLVSGEILEKVTRAQCTTVDNFWTTLENSYGQALNTDDSDNLFNLIVPPTSVTTMTGYIAHFDEYIRRFDNDIFSEKAQIRLFLFPLNPIIADAVRTQQLKSVEQVKRLAISNATMVGDKIFRPISNFSSTVFSNNTNKTSNDKDTPSLVVNNKCLYCQKLGHSISACRKRKNDLIWKNQKGRRFYKTKSNKRYEGKGARKGFIDITDETKN